MIYDKMNYLCLSLVILSQMMLQTLAIRYRSDEIVSPCDDPQIYTADRLINNSVRIYRGMYYWELNGIPDRKGFLSGPYKMWYHDFKPVTPTTKIVTVLGTGDRIGRITRVEGRTYTSWLPNGRIEERGHINDVPHGGLTAIFHNDNPVEPMFIGLESIYVWYFTTKAWLYPRVVGNKSGYIGGRYGENFPDDITAAFSYRSSEKDVDYYVYLFRKDKYCFRPNKMSDSSKGCDEWHSNRELFGCDSTPVQPPDPNQNQKPPPDIGGNNGGDNGGTGGAQQPAKEVQKPHNFGSRVDISIALMSICNLLLFLKN